MCRMLCALANHDWRESSERGYIILKGSAGERKQYTERGVVSADLLMGVCVLVEAEMLRKSLLRF